MQAGVAASATFDTPEDATNATTPRAANIRFRVLPMTVLGYLLGLRKSYEPTENMLKTLG